MTDLERFTEACNYPGRMAPDEVESQLREYLKALGITRKVEQLKADWYEVIPVALTKNVNLILDDFASRTGIKRSAIDAIAAIDAIDARDAIDAIDARDAIAAIDARDAIAARDAIDARATRDARDARATRAARAAIDAIDAIAAIDAIDAIDARDAIAARDARAAIAARDAIAARAAIAARDAIAARAARDAKDVNAEKRFTAWCVFRGGWWYSWDLSWLSATFFGAKQNKKVDVEKWSKPLLEAFCSGAWLLYWTDDTLFWVAKPTLAMDGQKRLHHDRYAAVQNDVENLYYLNGVLVPAFVVVRPDWITVKHIEQETNAEVRRKMIERYGQAKYLQDSGAQEIHRDDFGVLYRKEVPGDEPLVMVKVVNSTAESDGAFKDYFLRVPPTMERAHQAVAWTFDKTEADYAPQFQT